MYLKITNYQVKIIKNKKLSSLIKSYLLLSLLNKFLVLRVRLVLKKKWIKENNKRKN